MIHDTGIQITKDKTITEPTMLALMNSTEKKKKKSTVKLKNEQEVTYNKIR